MKTPDERGNSIQIIETINEEMHQVSKKEHKKIKTILSGFFKNPINFTERRQTVKASIEKLNESSKNLQNQKDSNRK